MMHDQTSDDAIKTLGKRKGDKLDTGKAMKKSKHCRASKAKWSPEEDDILSRAVLVSGEGNWKKIAQSLTDRSHLQCLHRWQKVLNPALVKGPWKEEEDAKLSELVEKYGPKDWSTIASHIPGRIGKQCRERWFNHLSPEVRKTNWTPEEDKIIIDAHSKIGNKWTNISKLLDGRPANAIKNHWNSTLLKRIQDSNSDTPRRDRTRTKKPIPMRATEFDYRTHFQGDDSSAECSPERYQISPSSSPEMPYQEPPKVGIVRFQYPQQEANAQAFFNSFSEHSTNLPASNSYTNAAWESWPAPNIIHLAPTSVLPTNVATLGHNLLQNHILGHNTNSFNHLSTPHGVEYGLGLIDAASDDITELYNPAPQQNIAALPVELQYCFDHSQMGNNIVQPVSLPESYVPLSLDTHNVNTNVNLNMGLLNLDLPSFCSLDM